MHCIHWNFFKCHVCTFSFLQLHNVETLFYQAFICKKSKWSFFVHYLWGISGSKSTVFGGEELGTTVAVDSAPAIKSVIFDSSASATIGFWGMPFFSFFLPHKKEYNPTTIKTMPNNLHVDIYISVLFSMHHTKARILRRTQVICTQKWR